MNLKLVNIATVSTGVTFRTQIKASATGNTMVIQMRDLGNDGAVSLSSVIRVDYGSPKDSHLVEQWDIIFRSRGLVNTAVILRESVQNVILSAPLLRIRATSSKVLPEYLLWWINQSSSQAYFNSVAEGTQVKMVSKRSLEALAVALPPLEVQQRVVEFARLSIRERSIFDELGHLRTIYSRNALQRLMKGTD